jgi:hypothetical protein
VGCHWVFPGSPTAHPLLILCRLHAPLAFLLACVSVAATTTAAGTQYYVNSNSGNDGNAGTSPTAAWATLSKLTDFGWEPGFRPGDSIFLDGTFTDYLWIQVGGGPGGGRAAQQAFFAARDAAGVFFARPRAGPSRCQCDWHWQPELPLAPPGGPASARVVPPGRV